jgi:hypothetical protein
MGEAPPLKLAATMRTISEIPAFLYRALKVGEIRLLRPASDHDGYTWSMEIVSLEAVELEFDALSYTWGSQKETYSIVCNNRSMRVHHNLYSALPYLARRTGVTATRPIWVDAVCINQSDEDEKRIQIQLMNTLYRKAKQVWIWLGCGTPEEQIYVPRAIALLPHIIDEAERRKSLPKTWQKEEVAPPLRNLEPAVWKAIMYLLRNPWYQRVWIVQEAALAAAITFLCGEHKVDGKLLESAVESDRVSSWKVFDILGNPVKVTYTKSDSSTVFWIRSLVQGGGASLSLDTPNLMLRVTLLMTGDHACFLPEDRVRGMLGLIDENELGTTSIELHGCTSTQALYTHFAAYILLNTDPFETQFWWPFFSLAFTLERIDGLPSWVPDFHHQDKYTSQVCTQPRIMGFSTKNRKYQASKRRATIKQGAHLGEISLSGKILDQIVAVYPPIPKKQDMPNDDGRSAFTWLVQLSHWEENLAGDVLRKPAKFDSVETDHSPISEESYWRTIFADNFMDITTDFIITLEACRAYRPIMADIRTCCEWQLRNLARSVIYPPNRQACTL